MVENFNDTLQVSYGILFNFLKKTEVQFCLNLSLLLNKWT